ncbi:Tr-type G domain-containing protein [Haematococcus lacustris]|uniref:Tr-type G domain-containing protein n=1 Tax=Haematococcus lacustris TaxID=44745 RepID=A0A699ZJL6_HAELA|nr:Tr-type G domain-containing protein [Haematococcus lacustris]
MGREHLAVATALDLPVIVVITKVDAVDAQQLQAVVREIQTLHRAAAPPQLPDVPECESAPWVTSQQQAEEIGAHLNHWLLDDVGSDLLELFNFDGDEAALRPGV